MNDTINNKKQNCVILREITNDKKINNLRVFNKILFMNQKYFLKNYKTFEGRYEACFISEDKLENFYNYFGKNFEKQDNKTNIEALQNATNLFISQYKNKYAELKKSYDSNLVLNKFIISTLENISSPVSVKEAKDFYSKQQDKTNDTKPVLETNNSISNNFEIDDIDEDENNSIFIRKFKMNLSKSKNKKHHKKVNLKKSLIKIVNKIKLAGKALKAKVHIPRRKTVYKGPITYINPTAIVNHSHFEVPQNGKGIGAVKIINPDGQSTATIYLKDSTKKHKTYNTEGR